MNEKKQNKDFKEEEFDQLDTEIYKSFVEAGLVIPQSEEEVVIAEKALRKIKIPPVPAGVKNSSALISQLKKEREERESKSVSIFNGILARAIELGMTNFQFAEAAKLTVDIVTKLDLGLITNYQKIPLIVVKDVADAIKVTVQDLFDYWGRGPRFAAGVEFKSTDTPEIEGQDFFDAVRHSPLLSESRRAELLAMEKEV